MVKTAPFLVFIIAQAASKLMEGIIKTSDNWAFLARFCFLSEEGEFEYHLEFNEDQGVPNLLLYYDTDDQWPAVYKSSKTCYEKEAVLHPEQNQVINLTTKPTYYRELSGCTYFQYLTTTTRPSTYTLIYPTVPKKTTPMKSERTTPTTTIATTTEDYNTSSTFTEDFTLTTRDAKEDFEEIFTTSTSQAGTRTKVPIKKRSLKPPPSQRNMRTRTLTCHNARRFRSSRERWWFIAVSNCNGNKGIYIKYKLVLTNGPPGDYWHEHFSADEFYILPVLMAFSIAYSFLMLGVIMCSIELKSRQLLHTTYKIFVFSIIFQLFGIIITSAAYLKYAVNGYGGVKVRRMGSILMGASETFFLLLLLLLAKGFTITRGRLPLTASVKLTIFMCLYIVTYISLFIYEANVFDPGEVLYLYESPAGYGLITLRILAWCMFIYSTVFTLKHYPEKANFYYPFNICGTLWFIAGPAFILSANTYIDKWVRESVVCAVLQFITFGGHLMFLILTMPSVANKNFPYHVRTTQIGIMELTGGAGASTIEQFGHHVYEPTGMYSHTMRNVRNENNSEEPTNNSRDIAMENVMNWSQAKNVVAIELPNFERIHRESFASTNSMNTENSLQLSRRASTNHEERNGHFQDYVRDVPIELFTISRMVVTSNNQVSK